MRSHGNILKARKHFFFLHKSKTVEKYYTHNTGIHFTFTNTLGSVVFILTEDNKRDNPILFKVNDKPPPLNIKYTFARY